MLDPQEEIFDLPASAIIADLDGRQIAKNYYRLKVYTAEQTLRYIHDRRLYIESNEALEGRESWRRFLEEIIRAVESGNAREVAA